MASEGYIQIKMRELDEKYELFEKRIKEQEISFNQIIKKTLDETGQLYKNLQPLIKLHNGLIGFEESLDKKINDRIIERLNEFSKIMNSQHKADFMSFIKGYKNEQSNFVVETTNMINNVISAINVEIKSKIPKVEVRK